MKNIQTVLTASVIFASTNASAGLAPVAVPVDSPWVMAGLAVVLATVAVRLLRGRRK